jgi:hypothetical protein
MSVAFVSSAVVVCQARLSASGACRFGLWYAESLVLLLGQTINYITRNLRIQCGQGKADCRW